MRRWKKIVLALIGAVVMLYVANASWAFGGSGKPVLLAHLGLPQAFRREGLTDATCTAARMLPPRHPFLENTIPSLARAFAAGADIAAIDVHPTADGEFVLFHDWTVDCRTNGHGVTRTLPLAALERLDLGYGYTADGGRSFPFRGRFVGAMPTLAETLDAFPGRRFLINIKSDDADEADLLVSYLKRHRADLRLLSFFGGAAPIERLREIVPGVRALHKAQLKTCLTSYLATGWTGRVPPACRNTLIFVPLNYRRALWGWPNLFVKRMARANSETFLMGPYSKGSDAGASSIDDPRILARLSSGYAGGIWTDAADLLGPALKHKQAAAK